MQTAEALWPSSKDVPRRDTREAPVMVPTSDRRPASVIFAPPLVCVDVVGLRHIFKLRGVVVLDVEDRGDGAVRISHRHLPVQGFGSDLLEALNDLAQTFEVQWEDLVECDIESLSPGARDARAAFGRAVAEVVQRRAPA